MKFESKFDLGQTVYFIDEEYTSDADCDICEKTGCVYIKGKDFNCPNCNGCGSVVVERSFVEEAKVIDMYINHTSENTNYNYYLGCGPAFPEQLVFGSREEAEERVKGLNK